MSNHVKEIMRKAHIINKDKSFIDALTLMIQEKTNSLIVVDDDGKLLGLLNTGKIIKQVVPNYLEKDAIAAHFANENIFIEEVNKARDVSVEKMMLGNPEKISEDGNLMDMCVIAISADQLRIPVVDKNDKPVGIITRTELKRFIGEIMEIKEN